MRCMYARQYLEKRRLSIVEAAVIIAYVVLRECARLRKKISVVEGDEVDNRVWSGLLYTV